MHVLLSIEGDVLTVIDNQSRSSLSGIDDGFMQGLRRNTRDFARTGPRHSFALEYRIECAPIEDHRRVTQDVFILFKYAVDSVRLDAMMSGLKK